MQRIFEKNKNKWIQNNSEKTLNFESIRSENFENLEHFQTLSTRNLESFRVIDRKFSVFFWIILNSRVFFRNLYESLCRLSENAAKMRTIFKKIQTFLGIFKKNSIFF